ncbi:hypothetical protein ACQPZ8_01390 [Actinomadura nitritigenes]|jgi:hypothetical protein|uniref:hypothetical protein n=1 Tax=Actinomadura nitritigenes TaxID=134602 RepID=UPI003D8B9629
MRHLLWVGLGLIVVGLALGLVPVKADPFECGSVFRPRHLDTSIAGGMPDQLSGLTAEAFGGVNDECDSRHRKMLPPMGGLLVAGIAFAVFGARAHWQRATTLRAAS